MKKTICLLLILAITGVANAFAASPITGKVTRTTHRSAVKKDAVDYGSLTYKGAGEVAMFFSDKDQLIMQGTTYTVISGKRRSVAKGDNALLFGALQRVIDNVFTGAKPTTGVGAEVNVTQSGNTVTITPGAKMGKKRLLVSSFEITIDPVKHRISQLRFNQKGNNFTLYRIAY